MSKHAQYMSFLNQILLVDQAAIAGKCEDSYAYSFAGKHGMMAVFDGCGGLGARRYSQENNHTAAYIASRVAADTVMKWFETEMMQGQWNTQPSVASNLKERLDDRLQYARDCLDINQPTMIGSLIRSFPTTASIVLIEERAPADIDCMFLWAGDSRSYLLLPQGLKQCTRDDLKMNEDAFDNLYADAPLSNMIHGDGKYSIHSLRLTCKKPVIIFTATDGTFGYLPSPMHYEYLLLSTMNSAKSLNDWEKAMRDEIRAVTGDDSTLIMAIYGWESFDALKASYAERLNYIFRLLDANKDRTAMKDAWMEYRKSYYSVF